VFFALMLPVLVLALIGFDPGSGSHVSRLKSRLGLLVLSTMLAGVIIMLACGGGSTGAGGGGNPATPAGTYIVTITAKDATGTSPTNASPATVSITVD